VKKHGIKKKYFLYYLRGLQHHGSSHETRAFVIVIAYVPDSLVFDISRILIDTTVSICYLQKARKASIEIARMCIAYMPSIRILSLSLSLSLATFFVSLRPPSTALSISRHLIRLILLEHAVKRLMLFGRSVFHQRQSGVAQLYEWHLFRFAQRESSARRLSPRATRFSPLLHPFLTPPPPVYIHYSHPSVASYRRPFLSRVRHGRLNGKNETYKTTRQRKILSYRTEASRINPQS